jgi:hypothetical protein
MPIVLGAVGVLVAGFVPQIITGPALPDTLPALAVDARASAQWHANAARRAAPAYVDEAFNRLGAASARRDASATALAARDFAESLVQSAGDDDRARDAIRESMTDRFIAALREQASDGFAQVALRHQIAQRGRPLRDREIAVARAWFAFRWEALGSRASIRQEPIALTSVVQRLSPVDRRALFAWVLDADCSALLGVEYERELSRAQVQRCSSVRRDFVSLASAVEPSYPRAEALASIEALEGRSLLALSRAQSDPGLSGALVAAAREAFARAHGRYLALATSGADRRIQRFILATDRAAQP